MTLAESSFTPTHQTDRDSDAVMGDTLSSSSVSPFKEMFSFDWFRFDVNSSKSTSFSPISPAAQARNLSVSAASPTSYFLAASPTDTDSSEKSFNSYRTSQRPNPNHLVLPPPPPKPLSWVWQCHLCRSRYSLSVTRRCLVDGHYYCSGDTTQRNAKRRRKAQSCASEFDYVGWQDWGRWRRKCMALRAFVNGKAAPEVEGCEGCSFPSQCRYESRPSSETLELEKYITRWDVALPEMRKKEVKELVGPENAVLEDEIFSRDNKENDMTSTCAQRKGKKLNHLELVGEKNNKVFTSSHSDRGPRKHRFYSNTDSNTSSTELRPTKGASNPFGKDKFDPALLPVSATSGSGFSKEPGHNQHTDLEAIEATLRAALTCQKFSVKPTSSISSSTSCRSSMSFKRRINSTPNDPEFEITARDAGQIFDTSSTARSIQVPNTNTASRRPETQSPLTDWFKQSKSTRSMSGRKKEENRRAATEADIASFLQLKADRDGHNWQERESANMRPRCGGIGSSNFEDINLSPVVQKRPVSFPGYATSGSVRDNNTVDVDNDGGGGGGGGKESKVKFGSGLSTGGDDRFGKGKGGL